MNEIKQIEEIILVVKEKMTDNASIDIDEDLVSFNGNDFDHIAEQTAEALYNAGYRKIPKGAVVLTGTKDFERIEDLLTEFDEMGFLPTTTCPYPNAYASNWKLRLAWAIGELRKETAREILKLTKEKCKELEDKYSHYCKSKKECLEETCRYEGVLAVKRELYELAKQNGVDIEE